MAFVDTDQRMETRFRLFFTYTDSAAVAPEMSKK